MLASASINLNNDIYQDLEEQLREVDTSMKGFFLKTTSLCLLDILILDFEANFILLAYQYLFSILKE